jgi:hypothetical protein
MAAREQELEQLIRESMHAIELEQQAAAKAEEVMLRQMSYALTMEEKLASFQKWLKERLPAGILDLLDVKFRDEHENNGYWYGYFAYRGHEYRMYINGSLGISLYAPRPQSPALHDRLLELSLHTEPQKAAVQLLASLGSHAKELEAATGAARKSAKLN